MNEDAAETITMLRESAQAIVPADRSLKRVRAQRFQPPGFNRDLWRQMCGMGWLGLRIAEAHGGAGLGMEGCCALAEELGKGLVPEPLIPGMLAARLLPPGELDDVLSGERIVLPAWQERMGMLDACGDTRIDGSLISGVKHFVVQGGGADAFLVAAGGRLALVQSSAKGTTVETQRCQDGTFYATLTLDNTPCLPLPAADFSAALDEAALATAAYLLGVMERAFDITLEYLRVRKQFDKPIGSFQALQHRAADMKLQIELTRASIAAAAKAIDAGHGVQAQIKVSAAKARASDAAMLIAREGVQMHGAIGYTDEADIGLYLRKTMTLAGLYGSAALHRKRYAELTTAGVTA